MDNLGLVEKTRVKWTKEAVFTLIKLWKKWDLLYDKKNSLFFNQLVRVNVYELICKTLQKSIPEMSTDQVRVKMRSLRSQLRAKVSQKESCKQNGKEFKPNAYWFDEMQFLIPFVNFKTLKEFKKSKTWSEDESTSSGSDDPFKPFAKESHLDNKATAENSLSDNNDSHSSSKEEKGYDEDFIDEPISAKPIKAESFSEETYKEKADEDENDDILALGKNLKLRLSVAEKPITREEEYENALTNFFRANISEITDKDLQDDLALEIMTLVFEYKRKQRHLDKNV